MGGPGLKARKGFTLIEIIAVVAIIALLMAVFLPAVFSQIRRGRVARLISESESLRRASLTYFTERGHWPRSNQVDGAIDELLTQISFLRGPYLDKAPRKRTPDNRYANLYEGLLMLNDLDDGKGDDSGPDRNSNQTSPDHYIYNGAVPVADASEVDDAIDGSQSTTTGAVVLYTGDDWTTSSEGSAEILIIIHEGF
jgi:prepilin-type N-terminal cleavage/methylation domain-containing protein